MNVSLNHSYLINNNKLANFLFCFENYQAVVKLDLQHRMEFLIT